ncbi:MAG: rod shape-determining protein MreC [Patescibacteria group bacterium]
MQQRVSFIRFFLLFFFLSLSVFLLARIGVLTPITGFFEQGTTSLQKGMFGFSHTTEKSDEITLLKEENRKLRTQLVQQSELKKENEAFRDQFAKTTLPAKKLIPATVIGLLEFIPGESVSTKMVIDKGSADGIIVGDVVVSEENLLGRVQQASVHLSIVSLISNHDSVITAKTQKTNALGLIQGQDSPSLLLGNVILSDKLEKNELVLTKGDVDQKGEGYPPDLIIGKIVSVNKKASDLFQGAQVQSLVDFLTLETVFILK